MNVLFFSFSLEEFIYNYLIVLPTYIIPKKGVWINEYNIRIHRVEHTSNRSREEQLKKEKRLPEEENQTTQRKETTLRRTQEIFKKKIYNNKD